ncbi:MAG: UDP-N-acetylmuramoyl-L-alanyl-D-glutamate--2,6-diaminopimelate ligase [Deltaproteobacteria bacterium]|nr:UDP-N-acetylmuramoyl-L-alanyl-D-glutamate--2,6-diaminopimelate ligase [Deltaproteobacteria bacterium]
MRFSELARGIVTAKPPRPDLEVTGITQDSRLVGKGSLFVAITGHQQDGHRYVSEAVNRGAVAVILQKPLSGLKVPQFVVEEPRQVLADLAVRFYGDPTRKLRVYGVTGTNGKTTLTYLLESIFREAGRKAGVIGTINYRYASRTLPAPTTTPESVDLQKIFSEMLESGITDVVMEVSSHALSQGRIRGIHYDAVAFTNLSRDHLDYHEDLEDYFEQKAKLFTEFLPASAKKNRFAVINRDDERGRRIEEKCPLPKIRVGVSGPYEVTAENPRFTSEGTLATIKIEGGEMKIRSSLIGSFNLENILVAVGVAYGAGVPLDSISRGIEALKGVPGRLEKISNKRGLSIFVDYAHTPQALKTVGAALKPFCKKRFITLFGCGGDRDQGKRPEMGKEVARFSDLVVVTSDNPRTEDPEKIIDRIIPGLHEAGLPDSQIIRIADRNEGLKKAIESAEAGDTILVAGKGHEDYQIIGKEKIHFNDSEVIRELLGQHEA